MERKKHKRLTTDTILKPEELKKARIQKNTGSASASSSSSSSGIFKAKLDFRSAAPAASKPNQHINSIAGPSVQSSHTVRPVLDDKWKEFGETINLNLDTFAKSIKESVELDKFNKVARMLVAALKSFVVEEKLKIEYRLLGTIAEIIKSHGSKLNHIPLHRALLFIISNSRSYPDDILQLFVALTTSLAKQQPVLDKCYITAFLHDAIGMNVGLGTANRCSWIEKPYCEELVGLIMGPFATIFPDAEMYAACQVENLVMADYFPKKRLAESESPEQLDVFLEFLKPWFDNIRGEVLPRPLFRALCLLCGYDHVRFFIASRLDVWITLQKFHREISEILLVLGCNIDATRDLDKDVIDILLKLNTKNMKTRTISGPFTVAIKRACQQPVNVNAVFESLVLNETGVPQNRSPANLPTMFMLLACQPTEATKALALVCAQEIFREKETSSKMLRSFLRELIRGFNHSKSGEFAFSVFSAAFLDFVLKRGIADDVPLLAVELVAQIPLATISSLLVTRENAFSVKNNGVPTEGDVPLISLEARITREKFQAEFVLYCEEVISWLSKARRVFPDDHSFIRSYFVLLYLEKQRDVYTSIESSAVSDAEIGNCIRIFGECGVSERMFLLMLESQLSPKLIVDIVSSLTQRAALYHRKLSNPLVELSAPFKLIDGFLQATVYPENEVPRYEELPQLCSRNLYWSAWSIIVLWLAGGDIGPLFNKIYEAYPILRYLVFCIMMKQFDFPLAFEGKSKRAVHHHETLAASDDAKLLKIYERKMKRSSNALAANAFTLPAKQEFRAPPQFDEFQVLADKFKLASRFSRCTSPPLLSQLVARVGAESSLFAVREMLSVDSTSASILSAECVFHALMYYFDAQRIRDVDNTSDRVIDALVRQAELNFKSVKPIDGDYLLRSFVYSLASRDVSTRSAVVNAFAKLFPSSGKEVFDLSKLSSIPRFKASKMKYLEVFTEAILVESDARLANSYLHFLTQNIPDNDSKHGLARALCRTVTVDNNSLQSSLCEYFVQYVNLCFENHQIKEDASLDEDLVCVRIGACNVALCREVPVAVVKLLSKFGEARSVIKDSSFESLVEIWLSPGSIPKIVDLKTGKTRTFLSLHMRKQMLKSAERRVVDAALDELSEKNAQEFLLVSQMSPETADKVIRKAENMSLEGIEKSVITNMYLLIRGYQLKGVKSGEQLAARLKAEIDKVDSIVAKEEPMDVSEMVEHVVEEPEVFLRPSTGKALFSNLDADSMQTAEISAWLKTNCSVLVKETSEVQPKFGFQPTTKQKETDTSVFHLPPSFIRSAMGIDKSAIACLTHIESHLKFFLSHEAAFQTLIVIVDAAANKFDFVRSRLENLSVRLLKSVSPPAAVSLVLQKHANNSRSALGMKKTPPAKATTFSEFAKAIKGLSSEREKNLVDHFMKTFLQDKGEVIESSDVLIFVRSIRSVYFGGNAELTAEKCLSNRWTSHLQRVVCSALLEKYREGVCPVFLFRLLAAYCKKYPMASYSELFTMRADGSATSNNFVVNKAVYQSLSVYFSDLASKNEEYEVRAVDLIAALEKQGKTVVGYQMGRALLQTSCANTKPLIRRTAVKLLDIVSDRLPYLSYKRGVVSSIRVLTNVESRESCIRRCEQIVDRIVEMPLDPNLALSEDICEEDRTIKEVKEDESKYVPGSKRPMDRNGRGGPPIKKGRFITAKDLPIPLIGGSTPTQNDDNPPEEPPKREWLATSHAMTRFVSLLREHPNIVKMKFPVLANFVSRLTAMSKKELRDENRLRKVELIIQAVIELCPHMKIDEISSVETALLNCLDFYEKHIDDASFGLKEQTAFAEIIIRACCVYLNHNYLDARAFLRDNRVLIERVCKRCCDRYYAEVVLDNSTSPV